MDIPNRTSDPARALENRRTPDALFTESLRLDAAQLGLHTLWVDAHLSAPDVAGLVADLLFR